MDSIVDPSNGNIVCRSTLDPTSFNQLSPDALARDFDPSFGPATFVPGAGSGCIPFDPFTPDYQVNNQARSWIFVPTRDSLKNEQTVISGFLTGDSAGILELPGGPIDFVLGAEYRKETSAADFDEFVSSEQVVAYTSSGQDLAGEFDVKEVFTELSMPLLEDVGRSLRKLRLDGAFRRSSYSTIGTTDTWGLGLVLETVGGITLRSTLSSAVRAPNIEELYQPRTNVLFNLRGNDPCTVSNVGLGSPTRQSNCEQALTALGVDPETFEPIFTGHFPATTGGNPDLQEETADTRTLGIIWQPGFVEGVTVSADYYEIGIEDAVLLPDAEAIFTSCYDADSLANVFCELLSREPGTGVANFVELRSVNVANIETSGVDLSVAYDVPSIAKGDLRAIVTATWLERLDVQKTPAPELTDDSRLFDTDIGGSSPEWVVNMDLSWANESWDASYGFNYSSKTLRPPLLNAARPTAAEYIDDPYVDAFIDHSLQFGYKFGADSRVYLGVRNLTNEYPDKIKGSLNGPSGRQGFAGRSFYLGAKISMGEVWR